MSNITDEFVEGPQAFLSKYVVQVANAAQLGPKNAKGTRDVYFWLVAGNNVALKEAGATVTTKIKAYWLPWLTKEATTLDLKEEAEYFFTSQLTGCRFSLLTKEGEPPKVVHIAGTLERGQRNTKEKGIVDTMGGSGAVKARRLSVSDRKTLGHGYSGQSSDPSSAFVYGLLDKESKAWAFHAQIVKAALIESVNLKTLPTPEILNPAYAI